MVIDHMIALIMSILYELSLILLLMLKLWVIQYFLNPGPYWPTVLRILKLWCYHSTSGLVVGFDSPLVQVLFVSVTLIAIQQVHIFQSSFLFCITTHLFSPLCFLLVSTADHMNSLLD